MCIGLLHRLRHRTPRNGENKVSGGNETRIDADAAAVASLLVDAAQQQIALQWENSDAHDAKAVGLIATNLVLIGFILNWRDLLGDLWMLPIVSLILSTICYGMTLKNRDYARGADVRKFYQSYGAAPRLDATLAMLTNLINAIDENDAAKNAKGVWLGAGGVVSILAILLAAILWGAENLDVVANAIQ